MADPTLSSLFAQITDIGDQLTSVQLDVADVTSRTTVNETDIAVLQNPPTGVPTQLLNWFAVPHSITEVDSGLSSRLTADETNITTNTNNIATNAAAITQEVTDRTTAVSGVITNVNDIQAEIDALTISLNNEINGRATSDSAKVVTLDNINSRIDDVSSQISNQVATSTTNENSLFNYVSVLNQSVQTAQVQIALLSGQGVDPLGSLASQIVALTVVANDAMSATTSETTLRVDGDLNLQNQVTSISSNISTNTTQIASEKTARISADAALQAEVDILNTLTSSQGAAITAETAARIAADNTLTANVANNTANIATNTTNIANEITRATAAEGVLTTSVTTNTTNIATNTGNITTLQTQMSSARSKYSVLIDGFGYITGYDDIGTSLPTSKFFVKDLNNNIRLQNPLYIGNFFPAVSVFALTSSPTVLTNYGTGASNTFHSLDAITHTVLIDPLLVSTAGSTFLGANYPSGGNIQRLGQQVTNFLIDMSAGVNRYLSMWYRVKTSPGVTTGTWYPVLLADNTIAGARTYEIATARSLVSISVDPAQVLELCLVPLNTADATISDPVNSVIYGASVSIQAYNVVTIS